jgi:hypothetical protein
VKLGDTGRGAEGAPPFRFIHSNIGKYNLRLHNSSYIYFLMYYLMHSSNMPYFAPYYALVETLSVYESP